VGETERTLLTDEVFVEIARSAMLNVNEVARQGKKGALAELTQLFSERIAPQIVVKRMEAEDGSPSVTFDIKLTLIYGVRIPEVVDKVRSSVKSEVESLTGVKVDRIDILIEKLVRPESSPELPAGKEL
jgi:uncharacterized alkaline shock family protein YloU